MHAKDGHFKTIRNLKFSSAKQNFAVVFWVAIIEKLFLRVVGKSYQGNTVFEA